MSTGLPFLVLPLPVSSAVKFASRRLEQSGYVVVPTFDLQAVRLSQTEFSCPVHGDKSCDCQLVILLVYLTAGQPASVMVQGSSEVSRFSFLGVYDMREECQLRELLEAGFC